MKELIAELLAKELKKKLKKFKRPKKFKKLKKSVMFFLSVLFLPQDSYFCGPKQEQILPLYICQRIKEKSPR